MIDEPLVYLTGIHERLQNCKTVEEVEQIRCHSCANNGHWGWCDARFIKCAYKDRIKEILGEPKDSGKLSMHDVIDGVVL